MHNRVERILALITGRAADVGITVILAMVLLVVVSVILRRVFNNPLASSYELIELMLVVVVFCAVPYTTFKVRHISISVLTSRLPVRKQKIVDSVFDLVCAVVFGLVAWRSVVHGIYILQSGRQTAILGIPYCPFVFIIAFGTALASFVLLTKFTFFVLSEAKE